MSYDQYLSSKIKVAEKHGIKIDASRLHESSTPLQRLVIPWALELGAALIGLDCGLGKTHISIEVQRMLLLHVVAEMHTELSKEHKGKYLIVTELGASETFINDDPDIGEGARLGIALEYVTNTQQAMASSCDIVVTNYERVRNGEIDFGAFVCVWLDEGNYIKNMASDTTNMLTRELKKVKFKYIATATPCPNELLEVINYAHVLGICDRGQVLTRFFQRNSTKAGDLTLHPQHKHDFYLWLFSWAVFATEPADLGLDNTNYKLPQLIVNWHEVPMDIAISGGVDKSGQAKMFADTNASLPEAARIKRESIRDRIAYATRLMLDENNCSNVKDIKEHYILWHHLEAERLMLKEVFNGNDGYAEIFGKQEWALRYKNIVGFSKGDIQILGTKPDLTGVGCNFQKHCHRAIAIGINDSWDEFYQAIIKRLHRFGQTQDVIIDALYVREEADRVNRLKRKWKEHDELRDEMKALTRIYGLGNKELIEERKRTFITERKEYVGETYKVVNNDSVYEWQARASNSVDFINSSFPFGNHYEYTDKYNDFGHNTTNAEFFGQMDFLIPELLRALKPGRICAVHLKNRIHYGSVTGLGFSIFHRFTHAVCDAMEKHGFHTMGYHYIPTCVVGENNQTYRLTYGEMQKDATKMGAGIPEEIWLFRKKPTTSDNAYADDRVEHNMAKCPFCGHKDVIKEFVRPNSILMDCPECKQFMQPDELIVSGNQDYSLAQWQIDADSFWHTSGNRLITPQEMGRWGLDRIRRWWNKFNSEVVYDYDGHVQLLKDLDNAGKLSREFTTLPLRSNTGYIWNDVNRMQGLNLEQSRRKLQNHICPQPFDEVDRTIELYSNEGEEVADPFGGIGTTGVCAIKKKRRAWITELNALYARTSAMYMAETELKAKTPTLFDLLKEVAWVK